MNLKLVIVLAVVLLLVCLAFGQDQPAKSSQGPAKTPQVANDLAEAMAQRLGKSLQVKTIVGKPIKTGAVTIVPIMLIDIGFGGGGLGVASAGGPAGQAFFMKGEARLLGFIVVSKKGTTFVALGKVPHD